MGRNGPDGVPFPAGASLGFGTFGLRHALPEYQIGPGSTVEAGTDIAGN
jgi:hypothetical protein